MYYNDYLAEEMDGVNDYLVDNDGDDNDDDDDDKDGIIMMTMNMITLAMKKMDEMPITMAMNAVCI